MNGLSFKTLKGLTLNEVTAKINKAKASGWKVFGEITKEEKAEGFFQVMAKHKVSKKKNETKLETA